MKNSTIVHIILDLTVEDYVGLWEIVNKVSLSMPAGVDPVDVVRSAVSDLLSKGWLTLYCSRELGQDEMEIAGREAAQALQNPQTWSVPEMGDVQYHLATTDAGDRAYYSGEA